MACGAPFCPGAVLMRPDDGAVDHRVFVVGILGQGLEHLLPHAGAAPAAMAQVNHPKVAEALGQVSPRDARAVAIEYGLDE